MKREGNLWDELISYENIHKAYREVLRGKRNNPRMGEFFINLEENLFKLQQELSTRIYSPGDYRTFWITDPKPRMISAAPIRDRIVHHALVNIIEPVLEKRFIYHSYACRKGKGNHRALKQFVKWVRTTKYVLKMDIKKFFPTIDHQILKKNIRRYIKDPYVLWLCDLIIDNSNEQEEIIQCFQGDDMFTALFRKKGLPIGNLTSQFFANVYLNPLDHFIKERLHIKRYLRYADDFCCFHDDKKLLRNIRAEISEFLESLRLNLNENKSRTRQVKEGIEFLGFVVFPDQLRLNQTAVRRQRRRIKKLQNDYKKGIIKWGKIQESLQAWNAHTTHGTTWKLRIDVFKKAVFTKIFP